MKSTLKATIMDTVRILDRTNFTNMRMKVGLQSNISNVENGGQYATYRLKLLCLKIMSGFFMR